jgi:5-hydroxyisourate hydrolase-like protein (transthyretin family)
MGAYRKYILAMGTVWAASLVLFALVYYVVIAPQLKVKNQVLKESTEKKQLFESALSAANEDNKKKLAGEMEELKTRLIDYVCEYEESANLTFSISRIAADKQVSDFTVKTSEQGRVQNALAANNLQENHIEVAFASNFLQFASFLNTLERHQPVIFVDRFKVLRGDRSGMPYKADMTLSYFARKKLDG